MEAQPPQQQPTAHGKRSGAARRKLKKERQALLDAQFAGLEIDPTKGWKLPPELVCHIIDLASYYPTSSDTNHPRARQRRAFLRSASLVCRPWREEAQKLLWKDVAINSEDSIRSFLLSADKEHQTCRLEVWSRSLPGDREEFDGRLVEQLLGASHGVKVLFLQLIVDFPSAALFQSSLADLKSLTLEFMDFVPFPNPHCLPQGPFLLQDLSFNPSLDERPTLPLITALLQVGVESATLELNGEEPGFPPPRHRRPQARSLQSLLPAAPTFPIPTLKVLKIKLVDAVGVKTLSALLKRCTSVETLTYKRIESWMFDSLGSQLRTLNITGKLEDSEDCTLVCNILRRSFWSLQRLERLGLVCKDETSPPAAGRLAIEDLCHARGILCVWKQN